MTNSNYKKSDDFKSVRNAIRNNPLEKVYIIYGEEAYLRDKVIDEIAKKRFNGGDIDPMSWEVYRSNEVGAQKVVDATRTISLFGGTKVVIYHDIDKLPVADIAILANYAANPVRAHLVLTATKLDSPARGASAKSKSAKGAPSKTALLQQLVNSARTYYFAPLPDIEFDSKGQIKAYIKFIASEKKLRINSQAVDVLRDLIGPNRALIERAVEKLYIAYGSDRVIAPDMVEEQVIDTRQRSVFELTKAISNRNLVEAMTALHTLIAQDHEPVAINGMLAMHARRLIAVKRVKRPRISDADIAKAAGIRDTLVNEYKSAVEKYSLTELYQFHADIFDADRSLKSKPMPAELVFSRLLLNLIQK